MSLVETVKNIAFDTTVGMLVGGGSAIAGKIYAGHIFTAVPGEPENAFATGGATVASIQAATDVILALLSGLPFTNSLYKTHCDEKKKPYTNLLVKSGIAAGVAAGAAHFVPFLNDLQKPREQLIAFIVINVAATVFSTTIKGYFKAEEASKVKKH